MDCRRVSGCVTVEFDLARRSRSQSRRSDLPVMRCAARDSNHQPADRASPAPSCVAVGSGAGERPSTLSSIIGGRRHVARCRFISGEQNGRCDQAQLPTEGVVLDVLDGRTGVPCGTKITCGFGSRAGGLSVVFKLKMPPRAAGAPSTAYTWSASSVLAQPSSTDLVERPDGHTPGAVQESSSGGLDYCSASIQVDGALARRRRYAKWVKLLCLCRGGCQTSDWTIDGVKGAHHRTGGCDAGERRTAGPGLRGVYSWLHNACLRWMRWWNWVSSAGHRVRRRMRGCSPYTVILSCSWG